MIICNITPSRRAADAARLSELVAQSSVPVVSVAGFEEVRPLPLRRKTVDPETRLKRRQNPKCPN